MKTTIKILFFCILFVFLFSCKDSYNDELKVKRVPISTTRTVDDNTETLLFTYNEENQLTKFVLDNSGVGYQVVYDGDKPTKLQEVESETVWNEYDIVWDKENILSFKVSGKDETFISCEYSSGKLSRLTNPQKEYNFSWDDENIKTFTTKDGEGDYLFQDTKTYNYSSLIHPLTNIDLPFALKFLIGNRAYDFLSFFDYLGYGKNVVTSMSINADFTLEVPETANFSIQTDDDGYPTYLISDDGKVIYEIQYKEI